MEIVKLYLVATNVSEGARGSHVTGGANVQLAHGRARLVHSGEGQRHHSHLQKKFRTYINGCFKTVNDSLTSLLWIIIVPDWIVKFPDRTEYVKLERPANPSWCSFYT